MKRRLLALCLAALLLLSGCSAMLNRSYRQVAPHEERPSVAEDPNIYQAKNYQQLINAILYFVGQGREEGVIRISDYQSKPGVQEDVPAAVSRACTEVTAEDPLGNYAVDYMKPVCTRVINTYEATISIAYRRTADQIRDIVAVTGSGAIRQELQDALSRFSPELVLRVGYYPEDADYILSLLTQAYYDTPAAALGMPKATVTLYPEAGTQHVVEIHFTYSSDPASLQARSMELVQAAATLSAPFSDRKADAVARACLSILRERVRFSADSDAGGSTAYAALVSRAANSEGAALAFQLLARNTALSSTVVRGTRDGAPHFWNLIQMADGAYRHVDATQEGGPFYTDEELLALGYDWSRDAYQSAEAAAGDARAESSPAP